MRIPSSRYNTTTDLCKYGGIPSLRDLAIGQILRSGDWKTYQPYLPDHISKVMSENPAYYERIENPMSIMMDRPRRVNIAQRTLRVYMASTTLVVGELTNVS
jgi:hypothetical protein